jgi:hypothetical protein
MQKVSPVPLKKIIDDLAPHLYLLLLFVFSYLIFLDYVNHAPSDLGAHVSFIEQLMHNQGEELAGSSYGLFRYSVYGFSMVFGTEVKLSAVLVNALIVVVLGYLIYWLADRVLYGRQEQTKSKWFLVFISALVLFSGNFFLPELGPTKTRLGNGSISFWHNPTLFAVKPLAFLSFFLFFYALEFQKSTLAKRFLILSFLATFVSIFAKPSYIIIFLPTIILLAGYLFALKKETPYRKEVGWYVLAIVGVSLLVLLVQYLDLYHHDDSSQIIIAPFKVWSLYSDNILLSIVISNLFVVTFALLAFKYLTLRSQFALVLLLGGIALFCLFAEGGPRFAHGNFGWSYLIAQPIVYLSIILDFVKNYLKINAYTRNILLFTLAVHLVGGSYYFILELTDRAKNFI